MSLSPESMFQWQKSSWKVQNCGSEDEAVVVGCCWDPVGGFSVGFTTASGGRTAQLYASAEKSKVISEKRIIRVQK